MSTPAENKALPAPQSLLTAAIQATRPGSTPYVPPDRTPEDYAWLKEALQMQDDQVVSVRRVINYANAYAVYYDPAYRRQLDEARAATDAAAAAAAVTDADAADASAPAATANAVDTPAAAIVPAVSLASASTSTEAPECPSIDALVAQLEELADLVEDVDHATNFCKLDGFVALTQLLRVVHRQRVHARAGNMLSSPPPPLATPDTPDAPDATASSSTSTGTSSATAATDALHTTASATQLADVLVSLLACIGNVAQNNAPAQLTALGKGVLSTLLDCVRACLTEAAATTIGGDGDSHSDAAAAAAAVAAAADSDDDDAGLQRVLTKALFALSALIRENRIVQQSFVDEGGIDILVSLLAAARPPSSAAHASGSDGDGDGDGAPVHVDRRVRATLKAAFVLRNLLQATLASATAAPDGSDERAHASHTLFAIVTALAQPHILAALARTADSPTSLDLRAQSLHLFRLLLSAPLDAFLRAWPAARDARLTSSLLVDTCRRVGVADALRAAMAHAVRAHAERSEIEQYTLLLKLLTAAEPQQQS